MLRSNSGVILRQSFQVEVKTLSQLPLAISNFAQEVHALACSSPVLVQISNMTCMVGAHLKDSESIGPKVFSLYARYSSNTADASSRLPRLQSENALFIIAQSG
jgi:hypothetical protein